MNRCLVKIAKLVFFQFFFMFGWAQSHTMEINRVIVSSSNNPDYIEFWPVAAPLWKAMGFLPTLALIADEHCPIDRSIGDVIRFDPIPGVPESLQAQVIRLLIPALFPEDVCLISDMDMLPISRSYFVKGAALIVDTDFLVYRNGCYHFNDPKYPMCYVAAKGSVFGSIFQVSTRDEIATLIAECNALNYGWNTDELILYAHVVKWEEKGGNVVRLGHDAAGRLDRSCWSYDYKGIDLNGFIDCHCPRPYSRYRESIDQVIMAICKELEKEGRL